MRSNTISDLEDTLQRYTNSRRHNSPFLNRGLMASSASISPNSNHGIHTIPKGNCAGCGNPIIGQIVIAMGKNWHPEHYVCSQCGQQLGRQTYFEKGGKAYCERDYYDLFSPRCYSCNEPILDKCVHALNKTFHLQHFTCFECGQFFDVDGYYEKDGAAYCKRDYLRLFGPKCQRCKNVVQQKFITAMGSTWDPSCFTCTKCEKPFHNGVYFELNGEPYCEKHYHEHKGSVCAQCNLPIHGRCVVALNQRFHPEHFVCHSCRRPVTRSTYKETNGQALCQKCYEKQNPSFEYIN